MVLKVDLDSPFEHWRTTIQGPLGCDERACQHLLHLLKSDPPGTCRGYMEACRILAHIFKDKNPKEDETEAHHGTGKEEKDED